MLSLFRFSLIVVGNGRCELASLAKLKFPERKYSWMKFHCCPSFYDSPTTIIAENKGTYYSLFHHIHFREGVNRNTQTIAPTCEYCWHGRLPTCCIWRHFCLPGLIQLNWLASAGGRGKGGGGGGSFSAKRWPTATCCIV